MNGNLKGIIVHYFFFFSQGVNLKKSTCDSLSDDEDHEINVESGSDEYEEDNEELDDDMCNMGTDNEAESHTNVITTSSASSSPPSTLPFSISRLLGGEKTSNNHFDDARFLGADPASLYSSSALFKNVPDSIIYSAAGGVIRVPAHRPGANGGVIGSTLYQNPALASQLSWLPVDPSAYIQRSAAAVIASHVANAKERFNGE